MNKYLLSLLTIVLGIILLPNISMAWDCNLTPVTRYSSANNSSGLNDSQTGTFGYDVVYENSQYYYKYTFLNYQYTGVNLFIKAPKASANSTCDLHTVTGKTPQQIYNWEYGVDAWNIYNQEADSGSYTYDPTGCGNTHIYSKTYVPINGVCGSANGGTYSTAPATNLCSTGTASSVTTGSSNYTWTCNGQYNGTNASCTANKTPTNGDCGTTVDSCVSGSLLNTPSDTPSQYRWSCVGTNGGTTEVCSINKDDANVSGNNGQGNFDPYCVVNPKVAQIGETITWSIVTGTNNEVSVDFDWVSGSFAWADSQRDQAFQHVSNEILTIGGTDISALVTRSNDPREVSCSGARFIDTMIVQVQKPIVEADEQCVLTWSKVDATGSCVLKNQQSNSTVGSINASSGSMPVDALQPGDKYFIECSFTDTATGLVSDVIKSEYVSCIKKGEIQEI